MFSIRASRRTSLRKRFELFVLLLLNSRDFIPVKFSKINFAKLTRHRFLAQFFACLDSVRLKLLPCYRRNKKDEQVFTIRSLFNILSEGITTCDSVASNVYHLQVILTAGNQLMFSHRPQLLLMKFFYR